MRRKFLVGAVVLGLVAVVSFLATKPERQGVVSVVCELPVSFAGEEVNLMNQSQAPCTLLSEVITNRSVFWIFGINSKVQADPIQKPANDMFAFLATGTSLFPSERTEYCAKGMAEFVVNNKSLLEDQARRQNSDSFAVSCTEKANI